MARQDKQEYPPLLPAGFHDLPRSRAKALCVDAFPGSRTRSKIFGALDELIASMASHGITGDFWIDGSFVTHKVDPGDVDVLFLVGSEVYDTLTHDQRSVFDHYRTSSLFDLYRIDNYGIVLDPEEEAVEWLYAYWLRQFGFSRADEMKGILRTKPQTWVTPQ